MPSPLARLRDDATAYKGLAQHHEHEKDVVICSLAPNSDDSEFDSTQQTEPQLVLTAITPTPRVVDKPIRGIDIGNNGAMSIQVHQYEVSDISRNNHSEAQLRAALYFVVVPRGTELDPADIPGSTEIVKYALKGEVMMEEQCWKIRLEQVR